MAKDGTNNTTPPPPTTPNTNDHVQVICTDKTPPAPVGDIAKAFAEIPPETQHTNAEDPCTFLAAEDSNPMGINIGSTLLSALACVPNSHKIKLIHGMGFHGAGIGATSPLDSKFLALHGEGGPHLGHPELLLLPAKITKRHKISNPTDD